MIGKIIVVFNGLKGRGLTEEAEMVHRDGVWKQSLNSCLVTSGAKNGLVLKGTVTIPSSIPRPDRRMGTREMDSGDMAVVVYS